MEPKRVYEQAGVAMTSRSYVEYEKMFVLDSKHLQGKRVLDVAGGASSFTVEAREKGIFAEAADPLYSKSPEEIARHGRDEIEIVASKMEKLVEVYNWEFYGSVEQHKAARVESLTRFTEDYASRDSASRYHRALLPELPFPDGAFDLVLCSHFLFLYEEQFDDAFHLAAIQELLRVCKPGGELRIYPLLNFHTNEYAGMQKLLDELTLLGHLAVKKDADLPFLPNSQHYLVIDKSICA
ncbi:class I SAM-dependent methyltransferase [Paenibacillus sp. SYP-B3998]|uniref:Class I SAM-dependent methyltransferase n=1 Tax=Paenibacillus sp. SYP-B3998 TaxID=2678564 RepID=A0A6G4A2Q6_9BACL|nr:class I SAM-dependent methyltransferase [Paenibacillus sp. SYP-B3998]NEW08753.1 class I SAM-dependent methyltransferase [Paenibacillus sp. SYP-B3998]